MSVKSNATGGGGGWGGDRLTAGRKLRELNSQVSRQSATHILCPHFQVLSSKKGILVYQLCNYEEFQNHSREISSESPFIIGC